MPDEGVISGWERSPFDLRSRDARPPSADVRHVVLPAAAAALRELQLLDSDSVSERLVFRAEASAEGVVPAGDDDDREELTGYVAAVATDDPTGGVSATRQRVRTLTRAIETRRRR